MAQFGLSAMIDRLPHWYVSLWRIVGLLLFISALLIPAYFPVGISAHPLIIGNLVYSVIIGVTAIVLLYGLINKKTYAYYCMVGFNGFFVGLFYIFSRLVFHLDAMLVVLMSVGFILLMASLVFLISNNLKYSAMVIPTIIIGALFSELQFASDPSTQPVNAAIPVINKTWDQSDSTKLPIEKDAWVSLNNGPYLLTMQPIIRFRDHNNHRFWSIIGEDKNKNYLDLECLDMRSHETATQALFKDDLGRYFIQRMVYGERHIVNAWSMLDRPVYSHLNHCLVLNVIGHQSLSFKFSSQTEQPIAIKPDQPLVFATMDQQDQLEVLQCADQEKGPFTTKATVNPHADNEFLCLYDQGELICRLRISDWIVQSSRDYSPTAGYGVAQNTMEVIINGAKESSPVMFWFSLAHTSVGRGFQSVGHQKGNYRMHLQLEWGK